ncbi:tetratricopeptide repeat protein [Sphingomonas sanxanigenens]|uniref:Uncharacterized protein n=1 Tax=Sphingomonas sanxanigenens DSM 19645 = NX02 TaxID=1123269 RepID=W0A744_9SPHN|nr:tetratricopeptide repeat protein [Sphingomonas sanxanigenens]AHE52926.1 hypothetical protein NX02_05955 [Sphingomonas sanxanigenens DSM 19645 = NX02]
MKKVLFSILVAAPLMAGCATTAERQAAADPYGYKAISAGDLDLAEARLKREAAVFPTEPSVLLNLAFVYAETGRATEAATLYRKALKADNVLMSVPGSDRPGWSHDIAKMGLNRGAVFAVR